MPKEETGRNATVLEMAQERECLLKIPAACTGYRSTVVACHQNEGKGMGLKQSDARSVWGCFACHMAYDASGMKRSAKRAIFAAAHARQMDEWQKIANDQSEPERYRRAARWAIQWNGMTFSEAVEAAERAKI
jgi:Zn-finger protein